MMQDEKGGYKNPPIGRPKGIVVNEFCDCMDGMIVTATVKGRKFRYCNKCSKKIEKEDEKDGSKKPRRKS